MTSEFVEITTKLGKLKGLVKKSTGISNKTYYSFQGIPYAKPPVGNLRFKAPEPFGKWEGVRDATKEGHDSAQRSMLFGNLTGNEDCLYLNVYTPQEKNDTKKPVMAWIHGGGFTSGSGSSELYGPDYLVDEDIVLVTINYRCGALGFLSLQNDKVPGNAGLKDQNLALRWVQENIDIFGGDSNNVTIFGQSAGGASVHYQILSPLSKGLFHKAILQSGFSVCLWAFQTNPKEKALLLAKELGCTSQDPDEVLDFLMSVPALDIIETQGKKELLPDKKRNELEPHRVLKQFLPCVESAGETPFLSDYPRKLMERGDFTKVPVIIGVTDKEGLVIVAMKLIDFEKLNANSTTVVPVNLNIKRGGEEERKLGKEILKFYTNKEAALSWEDIHGYVDFFSDIEYVFPMENSRQSFLKHSNSPVYTYKFAYKSPRALSSMLLPTTCPDYSAQLLESGACHGDELVHLFKTNFAKAPFIPPTADEKVFMNKFVKAWTSFAKTGDPNCKDIDFTWTPDNITRPHYLELGKVCKVVNGIVYQRRVEFWTKLYEKYLFSY